MVVGGVRVDEIDEGVAPNDNGRFEDGQTVNNVDIYLNPSIDFDINDLKDSDFSIAMKDGMCGGRTFKVASSVKEMEANHTKSKGRCLGAVVPIQRLSYQKRRSLCADRYHPTRLLCERSITKASEIRHCLHRQERLHKVCVPAKGGRSVYGQTKRPGG